MCILVVYWTPFDNIYVEKIDKNFNITFYDQ